MKSIVVFLKRHNKMIIRSTINLNSRFFGMYWKRITTRYRTAFLLILVLTVLMILAYGDFFIVRQFSSARSGKRIREYPSILNAFQEQHLKIDRTRRSELEILRDVQEACPLLPIQFWHETKHKPMHYRNKSCAPFPDICALKINNVHWQILETRNGTFYLFGAYYDVRKRNPVGASIRVLAMMNRLKPTVKTYCQVWFAGSQEPVITETTDYRLIWLWRKPDGLYYPYLVTCPITNHFGRIPIFVSVVENMCDTASNSLRVIYNYLDQSQKKNSFAVCVKHLDLLHIDLSARIVEWIELMKILGAKKIFFYTLHIHENTTKVLEYYKQRGEVEVTPITYAGNQQNVADIQRLHPRARNFGLQQLLNELISLNDCFYKNVYKYDYIALLDTDEVIMPLKEDNWADLMNRIRKSASSSSNKPRSHYNAKNVLFVPDGNTSIVVRYNDIPPYMYMLQHVLRETSHLRRGPKTFFDTEIVETVHNHWPVSCLTRSCSGYLMSTEDAQLHHYRDSMYLDYGKWIYNSSRVNDTAIWKYKKQLIDRSLAVLYDLDFFE